MQSLKLPEMFMDRLAALRQVMQLSAGCHLLVLMRPALKKAVSKGTPICSILALTPKSSSTPIPPLQCIPDKEEGCSLYQIRLCPTHGEYKALHLSEPITQCDTALGLNAIECARFQHDTSIMLGSGLAGQFGRHIHHKASFHILTGIVKPRTPGLTNDILANL